MIFFVIISIYVVTSFLCHWKWRSFPVTILVSTFVGGAIFPLIALITRTHDALIAVAVLFSAIYALITSVIVGAFVQAFAKPKPPSKNRKPHRHLP